MGNHRLNQKNGCETVLCVCVLVSSQLFVSTSNQTSPSLSAGNPVGKLQEMTQKKYMAPPEYEFQDNGRPPHEREHTCTVKLLQYTGTGKYLHICDYICLMYSCFVSIYNRSFFNCVNCIITFGIMNFYFR